MTQPLLAEKNVITALLYADGESMSLTGLKLATNCYDMEQLSAIVHRLCLARIVTTRSLSDSINGDCTFYLIGKKQQDAARAHLAVLSSQAQANGLSNAERKILIALLESTDALSSAEVALAIKESQEQVNWRLRLLTRNEWVSSRVDKMRGELFFLNNEQMICAKLQTSKKDFDLYAKPNLRNAINDISEELEKVQQERRALQNNLNDVERAIRLEQIEINQTKARIEERKSKLSSAQLTHEQMKETLGFAISQSQFDPVLVSRRLSFLRKLKSRPALEPLAELSHIIEDYEVALALTRNRP